MRTVMNMIAHLEKFPARARCYAYEGETQGVIIVDAKTGKQLGVVFTSESDRDDDNSPNDEGP